MQKELTSIKETSDFAVEFLTSHLTGNVVGLIGDLGAGKTTFVQQIGEYLGIKTPIVSPTYMLLKTYKIDSFQDFNALLHLDMYRINTWDEVESLGLPELWSDKKNLIIVEWADRIKDHLPENAQYINFEHVNENTRTVTY